MPSSTVVGRETELDRLREFLVGSDLQGLVLRGDPGIGKTILWQHGVDEAIALGSRLLIHRAVEAEAGLAFTGIADLVGPVLADVQDDLAAPRLRALRVALLLEDPGAAPPQPEAIGLAVLDVLTLLSRQARVIVAIDDLQWLDSSSAGVLPLALRRLRGERVSLLVSIRDAPGVRPPFEPVALFGEDGVVELRVPGLGLSAMHRLLSEGVGIDLPRPDLVRIHEASGGNPLFALELARNGEGRLPANLREALDERLDTLPQTTADVLLEAAALARPTVAVIADDAAKHEALERALDARVIELDGDVVRFTHPLLAARCYDRATPWQRREVHGRLARKIGDVEQHARHTALASDGADEVVASELDAAVAHAAARGATAAAAELADLAVTLTPGNTIERRSAAAHFHHLAGDFGRATELYALLAEELPPGLERADVLYLRALVGRESLPERARLCEEALREARSDDVRCADIHGFQAITRWLLGDVPAALVEARVGLERAERAGDSRTQAAALGRVALIETCALEINPEVLARGVALEASLPEPMLFVESPTFILATVLSEVDELDRAREMLHGFLASAAERGDEHTRQWAVLQLIHVEWFAGRLPVALSHAAASREIAEQTGEAQFAGMVERGAAFVEADLGLLDQARASARRGLELSESVSDEIHALSNLSALGHAELVAGDLDAAARHLRGLPQRQLKTGALSTLVDAWVDTIETLVGLGELDDAQDYLDRYLTLPSIRYRRAQIGAARAEGLLAAARGDTEAAIEALHASMAADDPPTYPLERGQTLLALGAVQRQAKQRRVARETLGAAIALFDSLEARPWADKARGELARVSGRVASRDVLTVTEQAIAEQAAAGRQNKEIAVAMFVTPRTVESHLTRIYRKLGVRSRAELAARSRASEPGVGPPK